MQLKNDRAMKKLFYILTVGVLFSVVACNEKEVYTPGEPDLDGCYGVYFPEQDAATTHYFDPAGEKSVTVQVKRTNAEGAVNVPFVLVGENTDMFSVSDIQFKNGEEETTFTVTLKNDAEEAVSYPLTIEITDPAYASKYSANNAFFSMEAMIVVWESMGTFELVTDGYWGEGFTFDIIYYDLDGVRYCKSQNERDRHALGDGGISEDGGFWGTGPEFELNFEWYTKIQNADGYDVVGLPCNDMGYPHASYGTRYYSDDFYKYKLWEDPSLETYNTLGEFLAENEPGSLKVCYYDPRGELHFYNNVIVTAGSFGAFDLIALKEGYTPPDYSLEINADVSAGGVTPITLVTGSDIASVSYAVYEGALGKAVVGDHVAAIVKGTEEATALPIEESPSLLEITLEETGEYTILVIPANEAGDFIEDKYAYATFGFLAEGDEDPVVADAGLETLSGKYIPQGYNPDTALEYWAYGENIVLAKLGLFAYSDIADASADEIFSYVKAKGDPFDAEALEAMNDEGFSIIISNLLPGTEYYAISYFSNGYEETWTVASAYTTGDPLPIYQQFDYTSYVDELEPENKSALIGTWNYYAVEYVTNKTGLRKYLGKVVIKNSETPDEGPDDYGLYDEYVTISGLGASIMSEKGVKDDSMEADLYGGCLYFPIDNSDASKNAVYTMSADGGGYNATYVSYFIPVMDGYWALVSSSRYASSYNFTGIGWALGDELVSWFYDLLLVDPEKDENGMAPAGVVIDYAISKKLAKIENQTIVGDKEGKRVPASKSLKCISGFHSTRIPFTGKAVQASVKVSKAEPGAKISGRYTEKKPVR